MCSPSVVTPELPQHLDSLVDLLPVKLFPELPTWNSEGKYCGFNSKSLSHFVPFKAKG